MLDAIGRQQLPATGCAAYLWSAADRRLVAMASADPATLRVTIDGKPIDLPRTAQRGDGGFGLAASTDYRSGDLAATLDLTVATRGDLKDGATVPQATLRIEQAGRDVLIAPLGGLIGCHA
ncbi:hypothetical protein [Sphingomonas bacterium]|uniref:hypothetical protein n=1 Tax=Sphingomonas bacterium TaxID=1895847 RepID=UPI0020C6C543|nr:hypothetical protein [Sphingomonas bacterium]